MLHIVVFTVLMHYSAQGCICAPSLSLLVVHTPSRNDSALLCELCLKNNFQRQNNYTFIWSLDGHEVKKMQGKSVSIYSLTAKDRKERGLWRCEVEEYPFLRAEYHLGGKKTKIHCLPASSLSLSLVIVPASNDSGLLCDLCLPETDQRLSYYTFIWSFNQRNVEKKIQCQQMSFYTLDPHDNKTHGLWRCKVQEYPYLNAEHYLGTSKPTAPTERKPDKKPLTFPFMFLLIMAVVTSVTIIIVATFLILEGRRTSVTLQSTKAEQDSPSQSNAQNICLETCNTSPEKSDEVHYAELQLEQKPLGRVTSSRSTIYASIV
ncbi:uncharacterized protein LOC128636129 [Bombina bombina]|uniref:uncharacterized protein LOC128636129 n=1 Tax=Bombina bombina TaxID=8345 RepID=UPI00235B00EE|nr:uncharacterized protein LOC128636129 [Bombina bombina]